MRYREERESGFGLAEMMAVIVLIGIITSIAILATSNQRKKAAELSLMNDVKAMQTDVQQYWTGAAKQYPLASAKVPVTHAGERVWVQESDATIAYSVTANRKDYCINASNGSTTFYYKHSTGESKSPVVCK